MESDQSTTDESTFHDLRKSGNRWTNYYRQKPECLPYGLLALLYILILALFITVFSRPSTSEDPQLVSKKEINEVKSRASALYSEMDQLASTFQKKKCEDGWLQFDNSCYYISKSRFEWNEARTMCQGKESDLVIVNSEREKIFLFAKTSSSSFKRFWLGLHDINVEGHWIWLDGTDYTRSYKSWSEGEPNDYESGEDCALMWINGDWNDVPCTYDESYAICERQL